VFKQQAAENRFQKSEEGKETAFIVCITSFKLITSWNRILLG